MEGGGGGEHGKMKEKWAGDVFGGWEETQGLVIASLNARKFSGINTEEEMMWRDLARMEVDLINFSQGWSRAQAKQASTIGSTQVEGRRPTQQFGGGTTCYGSINQE